MLPNGRCHRVAGANLQGVGRAEGMRMTADLSPNARAELEALARVRGPGRAEAILIAHQRRDVGSCLCGWSELGRSHARHQAAELREAGLLQDAPA